jgi:hypothetical protein
MTELTDAERLRLIRKALKDCGQPVTPDAVAAQFRRETGRDLPIRPSLEEEEQP